MSMYTFLILTIVCFKVDMAFFGWLNVCLAGMALLESLFKS